VLIPNPQPLIHSPLTESEGTRKLMRTLRRATAVAVLTATAVVLSGCTLLAPLLGGGETTVTTHTDESVAPGLEQFYKQDVTWKNCGGGYDCTTLKAPVDWNEPDGDQIELAISRHKASGGHSKGSLLINPGGNNTYSWSGVFGAPPPMARIEREYGTAQGQTYVTTYYPSATSWENGSLLDLKPGDDATNINITLAAAAQRRIRGVILDGNRQPVQETIVVRLRQLDANLPVNDRVLQFFPDNGKFQFVVTQSGTYELTTTVGMLSGRSVVMVRDRDTDASILLLPATSLTGRVLFDGGAPTLQGPGPSVILRTLNGQQLLGPVTGNGAFSFQNVPVSNYRVDLAMAGLPDAYLKGVRVGDTDLPGAELQVDGFPMSELQLLVVRSGGSIEGRVVSDRQQPVTNATVVVLPEGMPTYRADQYRSATVDATGSFQFRGLPAGPYNVYAWIDVDDGAWFNPAFLRNYDSYRRPVPVADSEKQAVEVVAAPVTP